MLPMKAHVLVEDLLAPVRGLVALRNAKMILRALLMILTDAAWSSGGEDCAVGRQLHELFTD